MRVLTLATSIRWVGWGFAEALLPIFIYSLSSTFAEAGLIRSTYEIGLILALPLIGIAADRVRASTLVLIGLFIYFFIGASYLLAGITGMVVFIMIARFTNGIAYALDSVGRATYLRRHTAPEKVATVFGYFDTVANFWWIIAALVGIVLIQYIPIPILLFMITPGAMIAFVIVWRFRKKGSEKIPSKEAITLQPSKSASEWSWALKSLTALNFFIFASASVVAFFIPIEAYTEGASLAMIVVFGIIATIPSLFGWGLGKFFDVNGKRSLIYGTICFAVAIALIPLFGGYVWKLVIAFIIGIILEFLSVGTSELVTLHTSSEHFGKVSGIMRSISNVGSMVGPLAVGVALDSFGVTSPYIVLAIILFVVTLIYAWVSAQKTTQS